MLQIKAPALPQFTWPISLGKIPIPAVTANDEVVLNIPARGTKTLKTQLLEGVMNQILENVWLQLDADMNKSLTLAPLLDSLNKAKSSPDFSCDAHSSEMLNSNRVLEHGSLEW